MGYQSKTASNRIGQVITSHVVTTSIHPWIFPFLSVITEPYMSFLIFIIITIVEIFGLGVGAKLDLLGLRPSDAPATIARIVDLCTFVTCFNSGETCSFGVCYCGTHLTCLVI